MKDHRISFPFVEKKQTVLSRNENDREEKGVRIWKKKGKKLENYN